MSDKILRFCIQIVALIFKCNFALIFVIKIISCVWFVLFCCSSSMLTLQGVLISENTVILNHDDFE